MLVLVVSVLLILLAPASSVRLPTTGRTGRLSHLTDIVSVAPALWPSSPLSENEISFVDDCFEALCQHTEYLGERDECVGDAVAACEQEMRIALETAFLAHRGQTRKSGEPYLVHPVECATILARSGMDMCSVVAGLLHDTVEDTPLNFADLEILFGRDVAQIVEGVTKVSKLPKMVMDEVERDMANAPEGGELDEQAENLRSMFVAMAADWRIVVVKLADRLHNMRTLSAMKPAKQVTLTLTLT